VTLDEFVNANDASVIGFLSLIREKLEYQLSLSRKMQLVDAIQELAMQDNNNSDWLSPEYLEILKDQERVRLEFFLICSHLFAIFLCFSIFLDNNSRAVIVP
jgi:hypothetical protein